MYMNLRCPVCGFNFGVAVPDDLPDEELQEIKECPCGAVMDEVDELIFLEVEQCIHWLE